MIDLEDIQIETSETTIRELEREIEENVRSGRDMGKRK